MCRRANDYIQNVRINCSVGLIAGNRRWLPVELEHLQLQVPLRLHRPATDCVQPVALRMRTPMAKSAMPIDARRPSKPKVGSSTMHIVQQRTMRSIIQSHASLTYSYSHTPHAAAHTQKHTQLVSPKLQSVVARRCLKQI